VQPESVSTVTVGPNVLTNHMKRNIIVSCGIHTIIK